MKDLKKRVGKNKIRLHVFPFMPSKTQKHSVNQSVIFQYPHLQTFNLID